MDIKLRFFHAFPHENAFPLFMNLPHVFRGLGARPAKNRLENMGYKVHQIDRVIPTNHQVPWFQMGMGIRSDLFFKAGMHLRGRNGCHGGNITALGHRIKALARMPLAFGHWLAMIYRMPLPNDPVTLSVEEVAELKQLLSTMRHDVNNHLSLMMAAVELIRRKPDTVERMLKTMSDQPAKITDAVAQFASKLERALHIHKD
jgi:hypothetical protein